MKRLIVIILILMVLIVRWAVSTMQAPPATASTCFKAAPYPADFHNRLGRVDVIQLTSGKPLPEELQWQTSHGQPPIGLPAARKGGRVRLSNAGPFPAHFLRFGGSTPQFFHQNLRAATELPLLSRHPLTCETSAGVAEAWARLGNTLYFRLNPAARYNNGRPVRADDYLLSVLLQAEQNCAEFEALATMISGMRSHGEGYLSVTLQEGADIHALCAMLHAAEPDFYADFGSRFREDYAQRIPPSTGPYRVAKVERGRLIELQRVHNWWGEKLPLCRHRFNADAVEYHFLTSEAQVWEFFLRGKLDALQTRNIGAWQERLTGSEDVRTLVYDAEYPLPPYGIALNTQTLPDVHLRRGLMHAMDMDGAIATMMRGEGQRLTTFSTGYGRLTPRLTPQYNYSPASARQCFAAAGFTASGSDGILHKLDGTRLSVKLLYTPNEKISNLVNFLIQSAASCGAEIIAEPAPWQSCNRQLQERSHEMVFWAVPAPETPRPELFFSSAAAPDYAPFSLESPAMEEAIRRYTSAPTAENLAQIDQLVYESAIWLPGWKENRVYLAHHPRLTVPPCPWSFDNLDAHMFWVTPVP